MSNITSLKSYIMTLFQSIILITLIVYACMNIYLYVFQRSILYHPVKELVEPKNYGMFETQTLKLQTKDNIEITAWYTPPKINKEPVVIYLHGNTGNLGDRTEKLQKFISTGMGQLALSWRGYGDSQGEPTEEGLYYDAEAAIKYLLDNGYKESDIIIYGESLGSGVAVEMSTRYNFLATVLEAPYTSISGRAAELYPYIAVKLLVKDNFDSLSKIADIKSPLLVFHGYLDETMPIKNSRQLIMAANEPKEARFFDHVGHTDFNLDTITNEMHEFVKKYK